MLIVCLTVGVEKDTGNFSQQVNFPGTELMIHNIANGLSLFCRKHMRSLYILGSHFTVNRRDHRISYYAILPLTDEITDHPIKPFCR